MCFHVFIDYLSTFFYELFCFYFFLLEVENSCVVVVVPVCYVNWGWLLTVHFAIHFLLVSVDKQKVFNFSEVYRTYICRFTSME